MILESNASFVKIEVNLSGTGSGGYLTRNVTAKKDGSFEFVPVPPVSGRVLGLPQMPQDIMPQVSLHNPAFQASLRAPVQQDGSFEFPRVYSGRYQVLLNGVVPNMDFALSEVVAPVDISVGTSDVTGVEFVVPRQK